MSGSTRSTFWLGQEAWALENEALRVTVTPQIGAKIVSLFDRRSGREWLVDPGTRPLQTIPYGVDFTAQDMSGWDEMMPTIVACGYPAQGNHHGAALPDHGELWPLAWRREEAGEDTLRFSVEGVALPYRLARTLSFHEKDALHMRYELLSLGEERMPYLWAAHPQFLCGDGAQFILPPHIDEVVNSISAEWGWGEPETRFSWPEAAAPDGRQVRIDLVGPPTNRQARKFFAPPETVVGWAGLLRRTWDDWLYMTWDANEIPYLGLWIDEGRFSHASVAALEPMTGYYDSLATAWEKGLVSIIDPGETRSWSLTVRLGSGERPFPPD